MTFLGKPISDDWDDIKDIIEVIEQGVNSEQCINHGNFMTYVMENRLGDAACLADHWNRKRFHKIAWFIGIYVTPSVRDRYFKNS